MPEPTASPPPQSGRGRRLGRRFAAVVAAVLASALALSFALPLVVRGPVARWALARATASRCGAFAIGGGHLGWATLWQLAFGRPIAIVVHDLRIAGPDGRVVLAAAQLEASIEAHRRPWRIVIDDALMARGQWRLAIATDGSGSADAFRAVPEAGRAACLDFSAARVRPPAAGGGGSVSIRSLEFQDVDAELDFPSWGLELGRTNALGTLSAGGDGPPILFEAHDVVAASSTLRIGRAGDAWTARVPFDDVAIDRVAVAPDAPTDLRLELAGARTGAAHLAGHASFQNIFPARMGAPPARPPGLDVGARWTGFGSALSRFDASWRPRGAWAAHLDGDLSLTVEGPFSGLAVAFEADGGGTHLAAHLAGGMADLTLALAGVDTAWMLDPALVPLFGGFLHGRFAAKARLAPSFAGIEADIPDADLRLDRRRAPSGPRRFELRVGRRRPASGAIDTLYATIGRVRLANAALALEDLSVDWSGLQARAEALVRFPDARAGSGAPAAGRPRSRVEAHGTLAVAALEDWIPGGAVTGSLRVSAAAHGTLERVALGLSFPPPATVSVFGQRVVLPARVDAALVAGVGLDVPPLRLRRVGGGDAEIGGRLGEGGRLAASLRVHDYPLAELPGLERADLPGALGGTLDADLSLSGALDRPTLEGRIGVASLTFDARLIGQTEARLRIDPDRGVADVTIDPGATLHATIRRRPRLAIDANLSLEDRALGPWLPPPLTGAPVVASGQAKVAYKKGAPLAAEGVFRLDGPGLHELQLSGRAGGSGARAHLTGAIDLQPWPRLWSAYLISAAGTAAADLTVVTAPTRPRVAGSVRIARDLVLTTPRWPAPITLGAGGQLELDGDALSTAGLTIDTPGLHGRLAGRATVDAADARRSRLALSLAAELDAARLPVRLPAGASARGRVVVDAKVSGTLGASPGPRVDGQARFEELEVQAPSSLALPSVRARGVIEAQGDTLRTQGLALDVAGVGTLTVGRAPSSARAELISLSPLRFGRLDLPVSGTHLDIGGPASSLAIADLDADVRLSGDARGDLELAGDVAVAGGSFDRSRGRSAGPRPRVSGAWYHALPPHFKLDLTLHGRRDSLRVAVPVLPDVNIDFQCRVVATNRGATFEGRVHGDGAYARAAVAVYDWLTPGDLRRCQIGAP